MPRETATETDTRPLNAAASAEPLPDVVEEADEANPSDETGEGEPDGEGGGESDVELEDFELDGVKAAIPKPLAEKLKAGVLKSKDYTKKTQELAAEKAKLKERTDAFTQREATNAAFLKDVVEIEGLKAALAEYDNLPEDRWQATFAADQANYHAHQRKRDDLRRQLGEKVAALREKDRRRSDQAKTEIKRVLDEGRAVVAREIPGWNDEAERSHRAYASSIGFTDQEFDEAFMDPRVIRLLNKAYVGDQLSKKATATPKPATTEPLKQLGRRAPPANGSPADNQSIGSWMRNRNDQVKRKAG